MKLICISSYYHPAAMYGGPVPAMRQLNRALSQLGHTITIFTTAANGTVDFPESPPALVDGLPVMYFPRWWFGREKKPFSLFFSPALGRALRHIQPGDYDLMLIHATWGDPGRQAAQAARRLGLPYICYTHGTFEPWRMAYKKRKKQIYMALVEAHILRRAAGIVVCNEAETAYLRNYGIQTPICRIPWGAPPVNADSVPSSAMIKEIFPYLADRPFILFLARLHPMKGLDLLIPAFNAIAREFPDWLLVVAGPDEGGYRRQLEAMVKAAQTQNQIVFAGLVTGEAKAALLAHASLYVLPSYSEGFSVSVVEALGHGLPVIITETCYVPEVKDFGAGLVIPAQEGPLREALRTMLKDENLRRACSANALNLAKTEFTWDAVAEKTVSFFNRVLK